MGVAEITETQLETASRPLLCRPGVGVVRREPALWSRFCVHEVRPGGGEGVGMSALAQWVRREPPEPPLPVLETLVLALGKGQMPLFVETSINDALAQPGF